MKGTKNKEQRTKNKEQRTKNKEQRRQHPQQPCQRPAVFGLRGFFFCRWLEMPVWRGFAGVSLSKHLRHSGAATHPASRLRKHPRHSGAATRPPRGTCFGRNPESMGFVAEVRTQAHGLRRLSADLTPWIPAFAGMTMLRYMGFVAQVRTQAHRVRR